jgi:hypothetical protein
MDVVFWNGRDVSLENRDGGVEMLRQIFGI